MDKYIGAKLIQAEPERNPVTKEITGYKVVYPDGYESWSPKDVFEKAYMKVDDNKNLPSGVSIGPEMVDDFIASTETITMGETTTVVRCVLRNGFDIVESSSCVDPKESQPSLTQEAKPKKKPIIICGDFNVAATELDLKNPKNNVKNAGFTPEEREKFKTLLDAGFTDSYRYLHPDIEKYSWWSYRFKARERNAGWRIDYFLTSDSIKDKIKDAEILTDVMGSDHCPIELDIDI